MAVTEEQRHHLYQRLEEVLGPDEARTLMEHLPSDVATKGDIDQLRAATKGDIDQLRAATKGDIDQLRVATKGDIDQLRVATKGDIDGLRHDFEGLRHDFDGLRRDLGELDTKVTLKLESMDHKFLGCLEREMKLQTWRLVTVVVAVGALVTAGLRL